MAGDNSSILILCGGRGSRLESRTAHTPKALVEVDGQPMLHHIVRQFKNQGFSRFVLATGYLSDKIETYARECLSDLDVQISNAGEAAGMLKRIHHAAPLLGERTIVAYGDTFVDIDYRALVKAHTEGAQPMTVVTGKIQNPFGIVQIGADRRVLSFEEKPVFDYYIGCLVFEARLTKLMTPDLLSENDGRGLVRLFQSLAKDRQLHAFPHDGLQITFNTEPELQNAQKALRKFHTLRENS
jgi:NDP-sugar pyrophosphorylase family protein